MAGVNKVIIMGNMGKDPELSYSNGGMAVCLFSLATSKKKKDGTEVTSWHRFKAFGKTAEVIAQYVKKGDQFYVEGELSYGQYEKDGSVRYTTDIIVNEFSFVGSAKQGDGQQKPQGNQQTQQQYQQRPNQTQNQQQNYNQNNGYDGQPMNQQQMNDLDSIPF